MQILTEIADAEFESTLNRGVAPKFLSLITAAQFTTAADRAYLKQLTSTPEYAALARFKPRALSRIARGFSITAPNGRAFTLTFEDKAPDAVYVNGVRIDARALSLEKFVTQVDHALHRTYVSRHLPWAMMRIEPADAVAVPIFVFAGLVAYGVYKHYASGGYIQKVVNHYNAFKKTCEAERQVPDAHFVDSASAEILKKMTTAGLVSPVAAVRGTKGCEGLKLERSLMTDDENLSPKFNDGEKERSCEAAREFLACTVAFRQNDAPEALTSGFEGQAPRIER